MKTIDVEFKMKAKGFWCQLLVEHIVYVMNYGYSVKTPVWTDFIHNHIEIFWSNVIEKVTQKCEVCSE